MGIERKLRIGIPKGALNSSSQNKGQTQLLLKLAGWDLKGYEPGDENTLPEILTGDQSVKFMVMRPRIMPLFLENGLIDACICGRDILDEWHASSWQRFNPIGSALLGLEGIRVTCNLLRDNPIVQETGEIDYLEDWINPKKRSLVEKLKDFFHLNFGKKSGFNHLDPNRNRIVYQELEKELSKKGFLDYISREYIQEYEQWPAHNCKENEEKPIRDYETRFTDLGYGKVKLRWLIRKSDHEVMTSRGFRSTLESVIANRVLLRGGFLRGVTEYPHIAYRELLRFIDPSSIEICDDTSPSREDYQKAVIRRLNGTESALAGGLADLGLDCVSSGRNVDKHNLSIIGEPVMESTAGLYFMNQEYVQSVRSAVEDQLERDSIRLDLPILTINERRDPWNKSEYEDRLKQLAERLKQASIAYGKTRPDSIYFKP